MIYILYFLNFFLSLLLRTLLFASNEYVTEVYISPSFKSAFNTDYGIGHCLSFCILILHSVFLINKFIHLQDLSYIPHFQDFIS